MSDFAWAIIEKILSHEAASQSWVDSARVIEPTHSHRRLLKVWEKR